MIAEIMKKMIEFSNGDVHDIQHFLKVWGYARTIGELEQLDQKTLETLEIAAIIHDIACPLCRRKYGSAKGELQEIEGMPLAEAFLSEFNLEKEVVHRCIYLVGHHHTLTGIDGLDYQILIEADYLVNAAEGKLAKEKIEQFAKMHFKTASGKALLASIYL